MSRAFVIGAPQPAPPSPRGSLAQGHAPLVRIEGLVKRFPLRRSWTKTVLHPMQRTHVEVLRGVSIEVRQGEFFGLLGPNGAGKTTLFKILATLVLPDAGSVQVDGRDVLADPAAVRRVLTPVIADERSLAWRLSAFQNLQLYAALYCVPAGEVNSTATRLLASVGLDHVGPRMVGTFSSGMKQRLLIARALLSRPSVLLLDEPTRSLDPVSARDFRRFLREEIVGRYGCTVLLATHDADEAFELCDRLAVLDRGAVVARGTAKELARLSGENRYRLLIGAPFSAAAQLVAQGRGLGTFRPVPTDEDGWVSLEGAVAGGAAACAELTSELVQAGIPVAEVARIPVSLAEMIERLVSKEAV